MTEHRDTTTRRVDRLARAARRGKKLSRRHEHFRVARSRIENHCALDRRNGLGNVSNGAHHERPRNVGAWVVRIDSNDTIGDIDRAGCRCLVSSLGKKCQRPREVAAVPNVIRRKLARAFKCEDRIAWAISDVCEGRRLRVLGTQRV